MIDRPAIFEADFVDLAFKPGLKVARLAFDIPIERAASFIAAFGAPDRVSPAKCAIARLTNGPDIGREPTPSPEARAEDREKPRRHLRDMPRSQQAAIKLQDQEFCHWLAWKHNSLGMKVECDSPDAFLKSMLCILSKTDLDKWPEVGAKWDALLTDFDCRNIAR